MATNLVRSRRKLDPFTKDRSNMKLKASYGKNKNSFFPAPASEPTLLTYLPMAIVKSKPIVYDGLWPVPPRLLLPFYGTFILVYFLFHNFF